MNKIGGRFIIKKTNIPNKIPTISPYPEHTSGMWSDTDIYEGELFINTMDNRMWFRNYNNEVIEIPVLNTYDLKINDKYLPNMFGKLNYKGIYNNEINLQNSLLGDYYIINNNCIIDNINYNIGDFIVFNGQNWNRINNSEKTIYSSDIIYDKSNNKSLNDILSDLKDNILKNHILLTQNGVELFKVDKDYLTYKNNEVYHSGNINNKYTDFNSNNLITNTLKSKKILSDDLNIININSNSINTKELNSEEIYSKDIKTNNLFVKSGKIILDDNSVFIEGNGIGFNLNHSFDKILEYKNFDKTIKSYKKIKYENNILFTDDLDIVNKKYVDDEINTTFNIDITEIENNFYTLRKNFKYINIDIFVDTNIEIIFDEYENNINSQNVIICVDTENKNIFNLSLKYKNESILINEKGITSLYFNSKNKKWYKIY